MAWITLCYLVGKEASVFSAHQQAWGGFEWWSTTLLGCFYYSTGLFLSFCLFVCLTVLVGCATMSGILTQVYMAIAGLTVNSQTVGLLLLYQRV